MARFFQYWRHYRGGGHGQAWASTPWGSLLYGSVKTLLVCSVGLIGLGVLVLLFHRVLAFLVAGLCFLLALVCLKCAWRVYRDARVSTHRAGRIHVDVVEHSGDGPRR